MIQFVCSVCGDYYDVNDNLRGTAIRCRSCDEYDRVPSGRKARPSVTTPDSKLFLPNTQPKLIENFEDLLVAICYGFVGLAVLGAAMGIYLKSTEPPRPPRYQFGKPGMQPLDNLTHDPTSGRPLTEPEKVEMQRAIEQFHSAQEQRARDIMEREGRGR